MSTPNRIVFQGEPGANSHIACHQAYPDYQAVPCPTFEDAFAAVETGEAALGMIPIENSVAGRVADIHHLMPTSGLHIVAEWFLPIRHQLMAPKGAKLDDIRSVESHVMALGQCRNIIRKLGLKTIVAADTAGSARTSPLTRSKRAPCRGHSTRQSSSSPSPSTPPSCVQTLSIAPHVPSAQ